MSSFPKLKLSYFNFGGRAEAIRLAFLIGNVPFEDYRFRSFQEFGTVKPSFPYTQVPVLEVDGQVYAQSHALLRYAGRLANLYPVNDVMGGLKIDEIMGVMDELDRAMAPSFHEKDEEKKKTMRLELAEVTIPRYFTLIQARLVKLEQYPAFHASTTVWMHEIALFEFIRWLRSGALDHIPVTLVDAYPGMVAVEQKVKQHPKVVEWYAKDRLKAPKLTLTYANWPGRAEPIRLAFYIGNIEFEDHRIEWSDLPTLQETLPFGQVPTLEIDGDVMAQSLPILRYAGSISGLYPTNDFLTALRIDEVFAVVEEVINSFYPTYSMQDVSKQREVRENVVKTTIHKQLECLDKRVAGWNGSYATGSTLTVADLAIYGVIKDLTTPDTAGFTPTMCDGYTSLMQVYNQVLEHHKVQEWNAKTFTVSN